MRAPLATMIAAALALATTAAPVAEAAGSLNSAGTSGATPPAADTAADVAAEAAAEPDPPEPQSTREGHDTAASSVDRAAADAFTERFNRQELDALRSGSGQAGRGGGWHALYPPRY